MVADQMIGDRRRTAIAAGIDMGVGIQRLGQQDFSRRQGAFGDRSQGLGDLPGIGFVKGGDAGLGLGGKRHERNP
jgi:hypothetical protein